MQGGAAAREPSAASVAGEQKIAHAALKCQIAFTLHLPACLRASTAPAQPESPAARSPPKMSGIVCSATIAAQPGALAASRRPQSLAAACRIASRAALQQGSPRARRAAAAAETPRTPVVAAAKTYLGDAPPGTTGNKLALELPTADLQRSVQFTALRRPRTGTAILVASVEPGSASAAAGVKPGLELLGLSDPVRVNEVRARLPVQRDWKKIDRGRRGGGARGMQPPKRPASNALPHTSPAPPRLQVWPLSNGLTSLKYVRQTIEGRGAATINVELSTGPAPEYLEALKTAGTLSLVLIRIDDCAWGQQPPSASPAPVQADSIPQPCRPRSAPPLGGPCRRRRHAPAERGGAGGDAGGAGGHAGGDRGAAQGGAAEQD